ncbi:MAG: hypothetical protein GY821_10605 [Gammaproteobacteria bacterium]|nr:hypothetical protein [Gammaproteobacteria bacterium]
MGKNNNTDEQQLLSSVSAFQQYIESNPINPDDFVRRGVARSIKQEYQGALNDFTMAERFGCRDFTLFMERAKVHNFLKQYPQAIKDINTAITMHKPTSTLLVQ